MSDSPAEILHRQFPRLISDDIGFACNGGWVGLLSDFLTVVERELPAGAEFHLYQAKEKMGGLSILYSLKGEISKEASSTIFDACERAEVRSMHICEACGERDYLSNRGGYLLTCCEAHAEGAVRYDPERSTVRGIEAADRQRYDYDADAWLPIGGK